MPTPFQPFGLGRTASHCTYRGDLIANSTNAGINARKGRSHISGEAPMERQFCINHEDLIALLGTVSSVRSSGRLWVNVPVDMRKQVVNEAGHDFQALLGRSRIPSAYVQVTDALLQNLLYRGICPVDVTTADSHYYLEVSACGAVSIRYQQIIGSWVIGNLSGAELSAFSGAMANDAAARTDLAFAKTKDLTLEKELGLLAPEPGLLRLPTQQLRHYVKIKQLLETAGGKYNRKGYFSFEKGTDTQQVVAQLIGGEVVNPKKDYQFFATPQDVGEDLCATTAPGHGKRYLEPSAGDGALADILRQAGATVVCIEAWDTLANKLREKGHQVLQRDFLTVSPREIGLFDAIVANPPFSRGHDIKHVTHMLGFLAPGGVLSAIMSTLWIHGCQSAQVKFRELLAGYDHDIEPIPAGAFKASGTSVATVRITIRTAAASVLKEHVSTTPVVMA